MSDFVCQQCGRKVSAHRAMLDVKTPRGVCPSCGGKLAPVPEAPGLWETAKPFLISMAGGAAGAVAMRYMENRERNGTDAPSKGGRRAEVVRHFANKCAELSYRDPSSVEACALCGVAVALGDTSSASRHRDMERRLPVHLRAKAEERKLALLHECEVILRVNGLL